MGFVCSNIYEILENMNKLNKHKYLRMVRGVVYMQAVSAAKPVKAPKMKPAPASSGFTRNANYLKRYWTLYLLLLTPMVYFIIFRYTPMAYLQIAIKDFRYDQTLLNMPWATNPKTKEVDIWYHFKTAFADRNFSRALKNTLVLNLLDLVIGFPAPIIMAILLNELVFTRFKKLTQTISYMPHFLSWIIIASLSTQLFASSRGLVNIFLRNMGLDTVPFLDNPTLGIFTYCFLGVWQNLGWGSIIYLAAMTAINPELYEAASVDGASRFRNIWHITVPGIRPTIITLLILAIGGIVASNFDRPYALRNTLVYGVSDVLAIFVYNYGIGYFKYEVSTAVGMFSSVINVVFLLGANGVAKKFGERGVW
jgi:putative aldouronate transport system permease protein